MKGLWDKGSDRSSAKVKLIHYRGSTSFFASRRAVCDSARSLPTRTTRRLRTRTS